jgi:hypothetical protein
MSLSLEKRRPAGGSSAGRRVEGFSSAEAHDYEESHREGDTRRKIAVWLIWAYLGLLMLNIMFPAVLLWVGRAPSAEKLSAVKDLSQPTAGLMTSVTGVIGFVLGHYFRIDEGKGS